MNTLKIATWNIRQGGKKAMQQIIDSLLHHRADVIVLTEYKDNEAGKLLISSLKREGWHYVHSSNPPGKENGVLILSVFQLEAYQPPFSMQQGCHRWNEVYIPSLELYVLGIHVPNINETYDKRFFWGQIIQYAQKRVEERVIIIGDFNTTRRDERKNAPLQYSNFIMNLLELGWADAWKQVNNQTLDYSWFSHKKNGFRLDYIFLSPALSPFLSVCQLSHHERKKNLSDHSLLIAEFGGW